MGNLFELPEACKCGLYSGRQASAGDGTEDNMTDVTRVELLLQQQKST
jgi:hypothetical protein